MTRSSLFSRPRLKLAGAYAGVMGIFLSVMGLALHEAIASSSNYIIERELETLSAVLEDSLQPLLEEAETLDSRALQYFPYLCLTASSSTSQVCQPGLAKQTDQRPSEHSTRDAASLLYSEGYTLYLLNLQGQTIAALRGETHSIAPLSINSKWQNSKTPQGRRYRIYTKQLNVAQSSSYPAAWGYLQIGRSYQKLEEYMHLLHLLLLIGLPISIGVIAITAWWLSGLAMQPIFQSYKQIEQFTADVAHELRTPLSAMRATAEAELNIIQQPQQGHSFESSTIHILHRQILRLSQMVQDLLLLSRLENYPTENTQPVNINEILEDLEEEFTPLILQSKIKFTLELAQDDLWVKGNPDALYRLFINLISNAIQHTSEEGLVFVKSNSSDSNIYVEIQDSGPGIPSKLQQYIFKRFYRINNDRSRSTGGTGLGLAIAKAVAKQHKGDITLSNPATQGACFQTVLPRLKNHQ